MSSSSSSSSGGIGFCGLLTVALVVLKLLGKITIGWWWVFCPMWIGLAIVLVVFAVLGLIFLIATLLDK